MGPTSGDGGYDGYDADVAVVAADDDDDEYDAENLAWWAPRPPLPTTLAYLGPPPILGLDSNASMHDDEDEDDTFWAILGDFEFSLAVCNFFLSNAK